MSLMMNGLNEVPNISTVSFGPNGITANPISAGTSARIGAKLNRNLLRLPGRCLP